ncbi:unnamed protein product [Phytophthora fragariaefolia]|uniref:Unnamed protein product n=1 Tax=Phytophthora fragariaefolia TaxID=1490495 RepID=A0A9W6TJ17_9STRA|nr:unnamed protein product [Phytophthora fragariaefolia]
MAAGENSKCIDRELILGSFLYGTGNFRCDPTRHLGTEEIPFLGCLLGKDGVCADLEKVSAISQGPVPTSQKDLRKWLVLVNYLHKYSVNYAEMSRPLTNLLTKDALWSWTAEAQQAFEAIKRSLQSAPILALSDDDRLSV